MGAVQLNQLNDAEKMYEASGRCAYIVIYIDIFNLYIDIHA